MSTTIRATVVRANARCGRASSVAAATARATRAANTNHGTGEGPGTQSSDPVAVSRRPSCSSTTVQLLIRCGAPGSAATWGGSRRSIQWTRWSCQRHTGSVATCRQVGDALGIHARRHRCVRVAVSVQIGGRRVVVPRNTPSGPIRAYRLTGVSGDDDLGRRVVAQLQTAAVLDHPQVDTGGQPGSARQRGLEVGRADATDAVGPRPARPGSGPPPTPPAQRPGRSHEPPVGYRSPPDSPRPTMIRSRAGPGPTTAARHRYTTRWIEVTSRQLAWADTTEPSWTPRLGWSGRAVPSGWQRRARGQDGDGGVRGENGVRGERGEGGQVEVEDAGQGGDGEEGRRSDDPRSILPGCLREMPADSATSAALRPPALAARPGPARRLVRARPRSAVFVPTGRIVIPV